MTVEQAPRGRIGSRERALLILLGIVAVLALAFMLLVNAGGDDDDLAGIPTPRPRVTATPTPSPAPDTPPITDGFEGRDPFQPLIVAGPGTGPGPGPGPGNGNGNGQTPGPTPTSTARPSDGDGESRRVALLDIFTDEGELHATVQVDGQEFTVTEGERFADNFRLLDLTEECGTFVFGDERFTLCIGQEVLK